MKLLALQNKVVSTAKGRCLMKSTLTGINEKALLRKPNEVLVEPYSFLSNQKSAVSFSKLPVYFIT